MARKKLLVVLNAKHNEDAWWWPYLPENNTDIDVSVARIPETHSSKINVFIKLCSLYLKLGKYDFVVTLQDGYATFLVSAFNSIFPFHKNYIHIVHEFMSSPLKETAYSKFKYAFLRFCFKSIDCANCSARPEIRYYKNLLKVDESRFRFIPLSTHPKFLDIPTEHSSNYIISAGRTGRDYETLARAMEKLSMKLIIITDHHNLNNINLPDNVEVKFNIPLDELISLTANSSFVVIPLNSSPISTGQSVILEAMALGKAVITTRTGGTEDYVETDKSGILVEPHDHEQMYEAINHLAENPEIAKNMGAYGRQLVIDNHLPTVNILRVCENLKRMV